MPSPFPGMNPYLERSYVWHDFRASFVPLASNLLNQQLLPRYFTRIDKHVFLHEPLLSERISFLEIRDREHRGLVTVIELLSPANKGSGPDRTQYLTKRSHYLGSSVHLVEIDLLRGGPRLPMVGLPPCDYCVLVSRAENGPRASISPLHLSDRLPVIPNPLRAGEPPATLDLQHVLHRIYDAAGYEYYIYQGPPEPALEGQQAEWAQAFVPHP